MRRATARHACLWLAVHLPDLALEAVLDIPSSAPQAVIDAEGAVRIHAVDARAAEGGVATGMTLAAAWALLPHLEVHERDCRREQEILERLAHWLGRFTPAVCIDSQALLLEVRGSLQLFGGAKALHERVRGGLKRLGFTADCALAPTPRGALWLARARLGVHVDQPDALAGVLGRLPLPATGFDPALVEKFRGIGARSVRDLLRLPREGFARRYGTRVLRELDQAIGRVPDVRRPVPARKRFRAHIDLLYEFSEAGRLLHPVEQLLRELDDYLRATQQGVRRLQLRLLHRDGTCSEVLVGFAESTRDAARIHDLVERKLETLELPAPVLEVELHAKELSLLEGRDRTLFAERRGDEDWLQLLERLRARLGESAVSGVGQREDHRPEHAWCWSAPGAAGGGTVSNARPSWLLDQPQPLWMRDGKPVAAGALEVIDGPERIEAGWWDGADVVRDYYIARDVDERRVWIYRDARTGCWWLQGVFG